LYWGTQVTAWTVFVFILGLSLWLNDNYGEGQGYGLLLGLCLGIGASHLLRWVIRKRGWKSKPLVHSLPRMVLYALLIGLGTTLLQAVIHDLFFPGSKPALTGGALFDTVINWSLLLTVWGICYFAYHWFIRGRKEEIRNLRLESANREGQLANLRAQLNPHFMFNALNGIRALIDEDPVRAKQAITQLSSILRNAISTVKRRTVPLGEELDIVKAYLELERMRFEERLRTSFEVDQSLEREPVPPMLLQTLVENAVRHGIAKLTQGGEVVVGARRSGAGLVLSVKNTGTYVPGQVNGSGIGLSGTRKRLEMIYGHAATMLIENRDGTVVTEVNIPWTHHEERP
jgi:two-component system LytT family sensor kinase